MDRATIRTLPFVPRHGQGSAETKPDPAGTSVSPQAERALAGHSEQMAEEFMKAMNLSGITDPAEISEELKHVTACLDGANWLKGANGGLPGSTTLRPDQKA